MSEATVRKRKCTRCNQEWPISVAAQLTDVCTDGTHEHKCIVLCGELSVSADPKFDCDLRQGHGDRHSGVDEKGLRWEWSSPVQDSMKLHPQHVSQRRGVQPTVGRICHYTSLGDRDGRFPPEVQAAIITKVIPHAQDSVLHSSIEENNYRVSLRIFYEMGEFTMLDVPFTREPAGSEYARGKWTWPAKV